MDDITKSRLQGRVKVLTVSLLCALEALDSGLELLDARSQLAFDIRRSFAERHPSETIEDADIFNDCLVIADWVETPGGIDDFPWGL